MSLRIKILLYSVAIVLFCLLALFTSTQLLLKRGVHAIHTDLTVGLLTAEKKIVEENIQRTLEALAADQKNRLIKLSDYADWALSYRFMATNDPRFIRENMTSTGIHNLQINYWAMYRNNGTAAFEQSYEPHQRHLYPPPADLKQALMPGSDLLSHSSLSSRKEGLLLTSRGPLLLVSLPILNGAGKGPSRGTFLFGKYLDSLLIRQLSQSTHLHLTFQRIDNPSLSEATKKGLSQLEAGLTTYIKIESKDSISGIALIRDLTGKPALLVEAKSHRTIYNMRLSTLNEIEKQIRFARLIILFGLLLTGLLLGALILFHVQITVLSRLSALSKWAGSIGNRKDFSGRFPKDKNDELGSLADSINRMLDSLQEAHQKILKDMEEIDYKEEALLAAEARFRLLFENSKDAVLWANQDGTLINCNLAAEQLFERTRSELIGLHQSNLHPEKERDIIREGFKKHLTLGEVTIQDVPIVTKAGKIKSVNIHNSVTFFNKNPVLQGVFSDISIQKQAAAEKKVLEAQLQQAQKMEAIGLLAGGVAHDFNNMLAAISGFTEIIQEKFGQDNKILFGFTRSVLSTVQRATDLTRKLLSFARKGKIEVIAIDLNETVREVMTILQHTIDKRIILVDQLLAFPATIMGDRSLIQNAVMNLAVNARDAMPEGGTLTFHSSNIQLDEEYARTRPYKPIPGSYVAFEIQDTGTGIEKHNLSKIFEPFFTTKGLGKGTGLGLPSVYGTVKSHNAYIEVESEPNKGTIFTLLFPEAGTPAADAVKLSQQYKYGQGHILLIDDEAAVRDVYASMLQALGYNVVSAENGQTGVEYYRQFKNKTDLVILDVVMPVLKGPDCLKALQAINPDVKIIVASGYDMAGDVQNMLSAGAKAFIQKPFELVKLSNLIYDILNDPI